MKSGWVTALRVARREARRAKGRSALVVAMVALPVAALTFGAAVADTFSLKPSEEADRQMGAAQAAVIWPTNAPVMQEPDHLNVISASVTSRTPTRAGQPSTDRLLALFPAGSTATTDQSGSLSVHTATGIASVSARMLDYADPLARGIFRPLGGRAPAAADEVALTPTAASRLATGLGGTIRLADDSRTFRVVGLVEDPSDLQAVTLVLRPGAVPASVLAGTGDGDADRQRWLVGTPGPITWGQVKQLNTHGVAVLSRYVLAHLPSAAERYAEIRSDGSGPPTLVIVLVAGMAMLEIVLLAGPAFAVGARRRRRDLALVAAAGGTPAHLRRIVLADGVVLGAFAAVTGVLAGIAVAAGGETWIEEHLAHSRGGSFRIYPWALVALAAVAVVTGLLAALVPAWIASRQDVVAALAGRRGITRSRRRWPILGVVFLAGGMGVAALGAWRVNATLILSGLAVVELGLVVCTPAIVGLVARAGRWLPLAPRIALRDTSRNRTAAASAISAVMAAVVGSLAIAVVVVATDKRDRASYHSLSPPGQVAVLSAGPGKISSSSERTLQQAATAVRSTMPVRDIRQVSMASCGVDACFVSAQLPRSLDCPYSTDILGRRPTTAEQQAARKDPRCAQADVRYTYFGAFSSTAGMTVVIDPDAAGTVLDLPDSDVGAVSAALRAGAVVVDDPRYLVNGRVTLVIRAFRPSPSGRGGPDARTVTASGFALPHKPQAPIAAMTRATAQSLGLTAEPWVVVASTTRMPTQDERDRLQLALGTGFGLFVEQGAPPANRTGLVVLAIVAGVITLGAASIATGLAAADGRGDLGTLAAVGASPRVRRMLSLSQSGVIAGLGSVLGVAAGLGASTAVLFALNQRYAGIWPAPTPYPITVPWLNLGVALVVIPLIAMLGAGLLTRSRLPIERRGG